MPGVKIVAGPETIPLMNTLNNILIAVCVNLDFNYNQDDEDRTKTRSFSSNIREREILRSERNDSGNAGLSGVKGR